MTTFIPHRAALACLAGAFLAAGCSLDVKDGLGPRVPVPNVAGLVLRDGAPAHGLSVELRDEATAETIGSTNSSVGEFAFADVPPGLWEVKVSGGAPGDFDSVSRVFEIFDDRELTELPELEIWAYGCAALAPEADAVLARPNPFAPLRFDWRLPADAEREIEWVRVYLYDAGGSSVWTSEKIVAEGLDWNGIGNQEDYAGQQVAAGDYYWRLKLAFADSLEARLDPRDLVLE